MDCSDADAAAPNSTFPLCHLEELQFTPLLTLWGDHPGSVASPPCSKSNDPSVVLSQPFHDPATLRDQGTIQDINTSTSDPFTAPWAVSFDELLVTSTGCPPEQSLDPVVKGNDSALHPGSDWALPQQQMWNHDVSEATYEAHRGWMVLDDSLTIFEPDLGSQPGTLSICAAVDAVSLLYYPGPCRGSAHSEPERMSPSEPYQTPPARDGLGISYDRPSATVGHSRVPPLTGSSSMITPAQAVTEAGVGPRGNTPFDSLEGDFGLSTGNGSEQAHPADDVYPTVKAERTSDEPRDRLGLDEPSPTTFGLGHNDARSVVNQSIGVFGARIAARKEQRGESAVGSSARKIADFRGYSAHPDATKTEMQFDPDPPIDAAYTQQHKSSHVCGLPLRDGFCEAEFSEVSLLNRHQKQTRLHAEGLFDCVVDGCKKSFPRGDSRVVHYAAHVVPRRNKFKGGISFAEMEKLIRSKETLEQAEKTVASLRVQLKRKKFLQGKQRKNKQERKRRTGDRSSDGNV